jgi:hypothetical protein
MGSFRLTWRNLRSLAEGRSAASFIELDQPANALWITGGGQHRSFGSVRDAVCFVMEELAASERASAWIGTNDGLLDVRQIRSLYEDLSQRYAPRSK